MEITGTKAPGVRVPRSRLASDPRSAAERPFSMQVFSAFEGRGPGMFGIASRKRIGRKRR